jgi:hypothetical protein
MEHRQAAGQDLDGLAVDAVACHLPGGSAFYATAFACCSLRALGRSSASDLPETVASGATPRISSHSLPRCSV